MLWLYLSKYRCSSNIDGRHISSEDGTILGVNSKTCEMFGYDKHELMGR